jgi:putative hydroxymethylpyrimidine transport system substrate-binding protein
VANTKNIHDKRIPRFLAAIKEGVHYLHSHPNQGWEQFTQAYPEANNAINKAAWFATLPYFSRDPATFNAHEWQTFAVFMKDNKMIKTIQPISRYAVVLR